MSLRRRLARIEARGRLDEAEQRAASWAFWCGGFDPASLPAEPQGLARDVVSACIDAAIERARTGAPEPRSAAELARLAQPSYIEAPAVPAEVEGLVAKLAGLRESLPEWPRADPRYL